MSNEKKKANMTSTARYLSEFKHSTVVKIKDPFPNPPKGRRAISRLGFLGPTPKVDVSPEEFCAQFDAALEDALVVPDTSIFTRAVYAPIWPAVQSREVLILPSVWRELQPWLKSPFANQSIRDRILSDAKLQANDSLAGSAAGARRESKRRAFTVWVAEIDPDIESFGYHYYQRLLGLRKLTGPIVESMLSKNLGRKPSKDEFVAEVQRRFGTRALLLARKGREGPNPNIVSDEHLIVHAVIHAIRTGREVFILTRDTDVFEQYFKLLCLMKEHYRAMLIAKRYADLPGSIPFKEISNPPDLKFASAFSSEKILQAEVLEKDLHVLPANFHAVNIYCYLLGGEARPMKVSSACFCAEREMSEVLKIKGATGGLSTDRFGERNCTIHTTERSQTQGDRLTITIGEENKMKLPHLELGADDFFNVLHDNEQTASLIIE